MVCICNGTVFINVHVNGQERTQFCQSVILTRLMMETSVPADIGSLQQADGSFAGDVWGEIDTRHADSHMHCWDQKI